MIYPLTAVGLTPGGSSTVYIYTKRIYRESTAIYAKIIKKRQTKRYKRDNENKSWQVRDSKNNVLIIIIIIIIQRKWNIKNKGDTSNNSGDWDYFKVIQKICDQHTRKTCSQGTTENGHIGHCTHTSESSNVKVQQIQH